MFGKPGSARWGWIISGHHLAANFTVVDGRVAFTPLSVGAAPQTVEEGPYADWRVLDHEIVRGFRTGEVTQRSATPGGHHLRVRDRRPVHRQRT
jgi:hypothetical protein